MRPSPPTLRALPGGPLLRTVPLLPLLALLLAPPAAAQSTLSLTLSGGAVLPSGSFEAGSDATFGVHFDLRTSPRRTLWLGFGQHRFGCPADACEAGGELVATDWEVGGRLLLTTTRVAPFLQAGLVVGRVERKAAPGGPGGPSGEGGGEGVSTLSVGGEVGGGLVIPLAERFALRPGVRYTLLNTRFGDDRLSMRWLVTEVAVMVGF